MSAAVAPTVGPYRVLSVLARGRRSQVLLAQSGEDEPVALKVAPDGLSREFALLSALAHPNVVRADAQGWYEAGEWLALETAAGCARGPADESQVRAWLRQAASALAHVHRGGWVHRDLKPANLLLRADGTLLVADLGSAAPRGQPGLPGPARVVGSPRHAAPEQLQGAPADPRADVYGLGTVLHEWLTGRPAFDGETPAELLAQHLMAPVPRLPGLLSHWQLLLEALLAKDPARRPADGGAVLTRIPS